MITRIRWAKLERCSAKKKDEILVKHWIASVVALKIFRKLLVDKKFLADLRNKKNMRRLKAAMIIMRFRKYIKKNGQDGPPGEKTLFRSAGHLRRWLVFRQNSMNRLFETRAQNTLREFLKDYSKMV